MNYKDNKGNHTSLNKNTFRASLRSGFTLIELLMVVLIIGILAAIALPQYQTAVERSRATEALTQMSAIAGAMERYYSQREVWPSSFNQIDVNIPTISATNCASEHGGKYFCLSFNGNTVTATRLRSSGAYTLTTTITETNRAFIETRSCSGGTDEEAKNFCYAIAGGADKVNNF